MQILFPMHTLERGGGCRVVAEAANGLAARGHRVFLALPEGAPLSWPVRAEIVRVPRLAPEFMPAADLAIATFYTTVPVAAGLRRPFIRFCLGFEPLWVPDPGTALATYRWPRPIVTISTWLQEIILRRTGRTSHLVHPGVDCAAFHPYGNKGAYGRPGVVFILRGPGYSWKGAELLWQAMGRVLARRPDAKLLLIANDEAGDPGLGLPYLLLRAPGDEELARIISAGDVFVFPSLFEGFGLPPLEAMACGTAVVTTANGGVRDYAQHGVNCLLVPPGRVEPLAEAILALIEDGGLRERLAAGGQATAAAWNWYRFYDEMHHLVTGLAFARG